MFFFSNLVFASVLASRKFVLEFSPNLHLGFCQKFHILKCEIVMNLVVILKKNGEFVSFCVRLNRMIFGLNVVAVFWE